MKTIFSTILFSLFIIFNASAQNSFTQNNSAKPVISIDAVAPPNQQSGNSNYLLSFSEEDYKNKKYVFYTDSNGSVAYLTINGNSLRLTGGQNPEHIMAYTGYGYTAILSNDKKGSEDASDMDENGDWKISATLTVYSKTGQVLVKKVDGIQINGVKK